MILVVFIFDYDKENDDKENKPRRGKKSNLLSSFFRPPAACMYVCTIFMQEI